MPRCEQTISDLCPVIWENKVHFQPGLYDLIAQQVLPLLLQEAVP